MQTKVLYLFTRTPLHVGAGSSVGAIDQPVQREPRDLAADRVDEVKRLQDVQNAAWHY
jgi:hypothetical protein